jgi:hypothetical protein
VDWDKVTLYIDGALVWGTEPISAVPKGLQVQYQAHQAALSAQAAEPFLKLINPDLTTLPLSEITLRYYFKTDNAQTLVPQIYYADLQGGYSPYLNITGCVSGTISPMITPLASASHYIEVAFNGSAPQLLHNDYAIVQVSFHQSDWGFFDQSNDYSFDATKTSFADWVKVTAYRKGVLIWGTEP